MVVSCLCTGTIAFVFYLLIGVPYPLVMAFFTGLMVFIPFIGPAVAWILAGLIGLTVAPLTAVLAAVLTIVAQMLNDNLVSPRVMGGSVELHPAVILVVIFIGAALGGVFGMLCAVPLAGAFKAVFVYYFEKATGRQLIHADGALFRGHASPHTDPASDALSGGRPHHLGWPRLFSGIRGKKGGEAASGEARQHDTSGTAEDVQRPASTSGTEDARPFASTDGTAEDTHSKETRRCPPDAADADDAPDTPDIPDSTPRT
jgi:hypothetical protein